MLSMAYKMTIFTEIVAEDDRYQSLLNSLQLDFYPHHFAKVTMHQIQDTTNYKINYYLSHWEKKNTAH